MHMKKIFGLSLIVLLAVSVTACGGSKEEPVNDQSAEETVNDEPASEELSDEELIKALKNRLAGEWHYPGIDDERLIFNEDGTGTHDGIYGKQEFTYVISVEHLEYANNGSYLEYYLNMKYDTGEEEDIIFFFNEERETMGFHDSDNGGYNGVIGFEEWIKK